jgi:hypothetical protein
MDPRQAVQSVDLLRQYLDANPGHLNQFKIAYVSMILEMKKRALIHPFPEN